MFKTITDKRDYIKGCDVEKLPITYDNRMEVDLFGNKILLEKNPWLWHLHLKVTNACNARCSFCVEQNSKCSGSWVRYLSQVDRMLAEMEEKGILFSVSVTGGEPLMFMGFPELCEILRKYDIKFLTMNTNATFLKENLDLVDGLFDFVDISRHSVNDCINDSIFGTHVPTVFDLKEIKSMLRHTKMRIQCVMCTVKTVEDMLEFIDTFSFADDLSFRKLMKLGDEYGVSYDDGEDNYQKVLDYAYDNFELQEQTIQDYYVYEIWRYKGISITFSYSNMRMLREVEKTEDASVTREFIVHPNGIVAGSWNPEEKVILC